MTIENASGPLKSAPRAADAPRTDVVADHWSQGQQMVERARAAVDMLAGDENQDKEKQLRALAKLDHFHGGRGEKTENPRKTMRLPHRPGLHRIAISFGV